MKSSDHKVKVGNVEVGGNQFVVIAGPCSIESEQQLLTIAESVKNSGAHFIRGGVYKMRTSPDSFQGLGSEALKHIKLVKEKLGVPFISEVTDPRQIPDLYETIDVFQVGSRNMYNYALLKELASYDKPVLLKRGFSALYDEWIKAAEYIANKGNQNVILCERGIRTFETGTRNTLDLNGVAYIKSKTNIPVLVDPSHGTGARDLVIPMSLAGAAAGADGLIVEVHHNPSEAKSDGFQALTLEDFDQLMFKLEKVLDALDKPLAVNGK